jgi:ribosomal protein S12 methylthiotransferase accessory factor
MRDLEYLDRSPVANPAASTSSKPAREVDRGVKRFLRGTHRTTEPAETLERLRRIAPEMGISRVANITGLDEIGIPVAAAIRPNSRNISVSQGKGLDLVAAKVSALMESVEGFHAESITLPLLLASHRELTSIARVARVERLPSTAGSKFHSELRMLWIGSRNLLNDDPVWVPFECVDANYTLPFPPGSGCFQASSNGLAGGNHVLEAISHAICELVERDAYALWWIRDEADRASRMLDLSTVDDPDCKAVLDLYRRAGVAVAAWDMTTDIGIPSFVCVISTRCHGDAAHLVAADGMGCHPSRSVALLRAMTEAAQCRLTVIAGARDDLARPMYRSLRSQHQAAVLCDLAESRPAGRDFSNGAEMAASTIYDDVMWELELLKAAGYGEILCVDLTQERFQVPVVRVVIPGLEGVCFQPDYCPGERVRAMEISVV